MKKIMSFTGTLEEFEFSDILQMLSRSGKSGKLSLTQRAGQGMIVLRKGKIIYAASSSVRETLGNILLCKGYLSAEGLRRGLDLHRTAKEEAHLGTLLVEAGLISRKRLESVVKEQVERVVAEMLAWRSGYFRFDALQIEDHGEIEVEAPDFLLTRGLPAEEMLLEVAVRADEADRDGRANDAESLARIKDTAPGLQAEETMGGRSGTPRTPIALSAIMRESYGPEFTGESTLAVLTYAQQLVRRGVLFRSSPAGFVGMGHFGIEPPPGRGVDFVREVTLPLDQASILTEVLKRKCVFRASLEETAVNSTIVSLLGGGWPREVLAAPLIISGRVVLVFYGDNLPGNEPIAEPGEFDAVLLESALTMERSSLAKREKLLRRTP